MTELNSAGQAYQMVTCRDCRKRYQCTPWSDYYNATTLEDGVCEPCGPRCDCGSCDDRPVTADEQMSEWRAPQRWNSCPECEATWSEQDPFAESREGMVSVHDHTGKCIGSMGAEFWEQMPKEGDATRDSCDHCGGTDIEQRGCSTCGAPVCCRTCCTKSELDTARKVLREVAAERDALRATLDAGEDPAVYVSWQRAANRAETEAAALKGELKALLKRVLEARLEHTCADHSHEMRWGCPECRLVDHMDRRGWESLEAVRDA